MRVSLLVASLIGESYLQSNSQPPTVVVPLHLVGRSVEVREVDGRGQRCRDVAGNPEDDRGSVVLEQPAAGSVNRPVGSSVAVVVSRHGDVSRGSPANGPSVEDKPLAGRWAPNGDLRRSVAVVVTGDGD